MIPTKWHRFDKRAWAGLTAVVMGNGTSLIGRDLSALARPDVKVQVCNGGFLMYPQADLVMCSDRHYLAADPPFDKYTGPTIVVTQPQAVVKRDSRMVFCRREYIDRVRGDIFGNPTVLVEGHTSVSTNISAAVLMGVKRIILLGVDLTPGAGARRRSYEDELETNLQQASSRYKRMVGHLTKQAGFVLDRGIQVINCSPQSALQCYPYGVLEDVL